MTYLIINSGRFALKSLLVACLVILILSPAVMAETSVWKASKGSSTIYLGGTIHLLRSSDYPLPPEFDKAFNESDVLMFETDIGLLNDPDIQMKLITRGVYDDGSTVEQHLTPKVYAELRNYADANGIPLKQFNRFRPAMLMTVLTVMELRKQGVTAEGVDSYYYALAKKGKKSVKWLESPEEQFNYLLTCVDGHEDEFVMYSLKELQDTSGQMAAITSAWRMGDSAVIENTLVAEMKAVAPYIYNKLLVERNRNWLPAITGSKGTTLILVGAAHLIGPDGLVEALRKRGYRVEKL